MASAEPENQTPSRTRCSEVSRLISKPELRRLRSGVRYRRATIERHHSMKAAIAETNSKQMAPAMQVDLPGAQSVYPASAFAATARQAEQLFQLAKDFQ